jgi:hypothetical protein
LDSFFGEQTSHWSVAIVGLFKHSHKCDTLIPGRKEESDPETETLIFKIQSSLDIVVMINEEVKLDQK